MAPSSVRVLVNVDPAWGRLRECLTRLCGDGKELEVTTADQMKNELRAAGDGMDTDVPERPGAAASGPSLIRSVVARGAVARAAELLGSIERELQAAGRQGVGVQLTASLAVGAVKGDLVLALASVDAMMEEMVDVARQRRIADEAAAAAMEQMRSVQHAMADQVAAHMQELAAVDLKAKSLRGQVSSLKGQLNRAKSRR